MATERYVVLGLAQARASWFGDVARWATTAALPVDFVKVVSVEELRARLRSGRVFSALLIDGALPALDRDVVDLARANGCAVVAIDDQRAHRSWRDLGVDAVLPADFERGLLLDALKAVARPIARSDEVAAGPPSLDHAPGGWRGRAVAVTGSGGVGRSTLAMALTAGLAADPRDRGLVVLADLALRAQQALLHDAGDVVPGLLELVESHRGAAPDLDEVRAHCFTVREGGYDLLLGLRRHRDWTALRSRALAVALDNLRRAYRMVVSDVDPDVEGEAECGSVDVEERNLLARTTLRDADLVVVVGQRGLAGLDAQLRVVRDIAELGVPGSRIVPVVNRAPRNPRARAEAAAAPHGHRPHRDQTRRRQPRRRETHRRQPHEPEPLGRRAAGDPWGTAGQPGAGRPRGRHRRSGGPPRTAAMGSTGRQLRSSFRPPSRSARAAIGGLRWHLPGAHRVLAGRGQSVRSSGAAASCGCPPTASPSRR